MQSFCRYGRPVGAGSGGGDIFFVPQRPYVVLGSLREQLLYPTWAEASDLAGSPPADAVSSQPHRCAFGWTNWTASLRLLLHAASQGTLEICAQLI